MINSGPVPGVSSSGLRTGPANADNCGHGNKTQQQQPPRGAVGRLVSSVRPRSATPGKRRSGLVELHAAGTTKSAGSAGRAATVSRMRWGQGLAWANFMSRGAIRPQRGASPVAKARLDIYETKAGREGRVCRSVRGVPVRCNQSRADAAGVRVALFASPPHVRVDAKVVLRCADQGSGPAGRGL
jgi:hypothetical protein